MEKILSTKRESLISFILDQEGIIHETQAEEERIAELLEEIPEEIGTDPVDVKGSGEYLILTDQEADEKAREEILSSAWAFKSSFLSSHTGIDEKTLEIIQEKCEDANEPILRLIKDQDHFIDEAISWDGRGHFIGQYDGEEHEQDQYFIYIINQ